MMVNKDSSRHAVSSRVAIIAYGTNVQILRTTVQPLRTTVPENQCPGNHCLRGVEPVSLGTTVPMPEQLFSQAPSNKVLTVRRNRLFDLLLEMLILLKISLKV